MILNEEHIKLLEEERSISGLGTPHASENGTAEPHASVSASSNPATDNVEPDTYTCLPFKTSLSFLAFFDPNIRNQSFSLHSWQVETNEDISLGRTRVGGVVIRERIPDSLHPYKYCLCAANGSGKDAFVIAPLALWFVTCKIKSKVIITSSSGAQLSTQTEHYIATLAREVNNWATQTMGKEILKINKRHIYCLCSGSVIHMFATDEGEKAEGHHPTAPGCEMLLIVNEAKSVSPVIFDALRRCTGYNYWINVSSPGEKKGHFYKSWNTWPNRRRVTYFDCPHHAPDEFEADRNELGEYSALFRSKWLALFTSAGGLNVIKEEKLEALREAIVGNRIKTILTTRPIRIGIDFALSNRGDESVVSVWQGNKQIEQYTMRIQDSTILTEKIYSILLKHVQMDHKHIYADEGGLGRPIIDQLNRRGFKINRILNNGKSSDPRRFKNRGAQSWYKVSRLIEEKVIIPLDDPRLFSQLSSRKYKESEAGLDKMTLEPKEDMIAEGFESPDRADAMVLAFTDASIEEFLKGVEEAERQPIQISPEQSISELKESIRRKRMEPIFIRGRAHGSLQIAMGL